MDVREKLVELLNNSFAEQDEKRGLLTAPYTATDLIAHGVTVQELNGCDFCRKFDFSGAKAEVTKYGAHISLGVCSTKFTNEERFKFCPMCGRRLPQPSKGE